MGPKRKLSPMHLSPPRRRESPRRHDSISAIKKESKKDYDPEHLLKRANEVMNKGNRRDSRSPKRRDSPRRHNTRSRSGSRSRDRRQRGTLSPRRRDAMSPRRRSWQDSQDGRRQESSSPKLGSSIGAVIKSSKSDYDPEKLLKKANQVLNKGGRHDSRSPRRRDSGSPRRRDSRPIDGDKRRRGGSRERSHEADNKHGSYDPLSLVKSAVVASKVSAVEPPRRRKDDKPKHKANHKLILKAAEESVKESSRDRPGGKREANGEKKVSVEDIHTKRAKLPEAGHKEPRNRDHDDHRRREGRIDRVEENRRAREDRYEEDNRRERDDRRISREDETRKVREERSRGQDDRRGGKVSMEER